MPVKLILFCFVFFTSPDDCRKIEFADRLENKALINHVIISFREIKEEICEINTGRKNGFTNVCERCKYVVNLELQICITFALSAKVWANTYIC